MNDDDEASRLDGGESSIDTVLAIEFDLDLLGFVWEAGSEDVESIIQTLVLPIPSIRRSSDIDRRDCRRDCIWVEEGDGAVWSRTIANDRVVGYAREEVASVSRRERDESRIWRDVLFINFLPFRVCGKAYGAMSIEPNKMAALAPAIVMVNELRSIESCFDIRELTRTEGINKEPTAG